MDLDEEIKSREAWEIGSESREKGDLLPCSSPLCMATGFRNYSEKRFKDVFKGIVTVAPSCLILFSWMISLHTILSLKISKKFLVSKLIPDSALVTKWGTSTDTCMATCQACTCAKATMCRGISLADQVECIQPPFMGTRFYGMEITTIHLGWVKVSCGKKME